MQRYIERWKRADEYALTVAGRVSAALECAGLTPCDIGGDELEAALVRHEGPLTVAQIAIAADHLKCSPAPWMGY